MGKESCEASSYQNLWWEPLTWATIMIKKAKNAGQLGDPKDLLKDILKFQVDLGHILRHKNSKLPVIFSQVKIFSLLSCLISLAPRLCGWQ